MSAKWCFKLYFPGRKKKKKLSVQRGTLISYVIVQPETLQWLLESVEITGSWRIQCWNSKLLQHLVQREHAISTLPRSFVNPYNWPEQMQILKRSQAMCYITRQKGKPIWFPALLLLHRIIILKVCLICKKKKLSSIRKLFHGMNGLIQYDNIQPQLMN